MKHELLKLIQKRRQSFDDRMAYRRYVKICKEECYQSDSFFL